MEIQEAFDKYKEASTLLAELILKSNMEPHLAIGSILIMDKTGQLIQDNIKGVKITG